MTQQKSQLHKTLWDIANTLRGNMGADEFERFLNEEKREQLQEICETNKLHLDKVEDIISKIPYYGSISNIPNGREDIFETFVNLPGLLQRDKAISDLTIELDDFIETFYERGAA